MKARIRRLLVDECCLYAANSKFDLAAKAGIAVLGVGNAHLASGTRDDVIYRFCLSNPSIFDSIVTADSDFRVLDADHSDCIPRPIILRIPRALLNNRHQDQIDELALIINTINRFPDKFTTWYFNVRSFADQVRRGKLP